MKVKLFISLTINNNPRPGEGSPMGGVLYTARVPTDAKLEKFEIKAFFFLSMGMHPVYCKIGGRVPHKVVIPVLCNAGT